MTRERIARNLARLFAASRLTKTELANAAMLSRNTIDEILKAKCSPIADSLGHIADALGIDVGQLTAKPSVKRANVTRTRRPR